MLFAGIVCRVFLVVSKDLKIKFSHNVFASDFSGQTLFSSCCCCFSVLENFYPSQRFNATICLSSFQVLAVTLQPVKLFCSRFTTTMDIILSNWLSIKIIKTQCITVPTTDPLLVMVQDMYMTSTYRITLSSTNLPIHTPGVALHTLYPPGIQLVTVDFSLEPYTSLLLTSKCSTT